MPPNKGPVKKASKPTYVKTRGGKVLNKSPRKVTGPTRANVKTTTKAFGKGTTNASVGTQRAANVERAKEQRAIRKIRQAERTTKPLTNAQRVRMGGDAVHSPKARPLRLIDSITKAGQTRIAAGERQQQTDLRKTMKEADKTLNRKGSRQLGKRDKAIDTLRSLGGLVDKPSKVQKAGERQTARYEKQVKKQLERSAMGETPVGETAWRGGKKGPAKPNLKTLGDVASGKATAEIAEGAKKAVDKASNLTLKAVKAVDKAVSPKDKKGKQKVSTMGLAAGLGPDPKSLEQAVKVGGNAAKDVVDVAQNAVPSVYLPGREVVRGRPKEAAKMVAEPFIETAKHPGKSLVEHPVITALMVSGAYGGVGRGIGKGARVTTKGKVGGVMGRAPAVRPGTIIRQDRNYSRNIITKQIQKANDRRTGGKTLEGQSGDRYVARRMDFAVSRNEGTRRVERTKSEQRATEDRGKKPTAATRIGSERIIVDRTAASNPGRKTTLKYAPDRPAAKGSGRDVVRYLKEVEKGKKMKVRTYEPVKPSTLLDELRGYREQVAANTGGDASMRGTRKTMLAELDKAIKNFDPEKVARNADEYARFSVELQDELVRLRLIDGEQARRARMIPYAVRYMGARKLTRDELVANVETAKKAVATARRKERAVGREVGRGRTGLAQASGRAQILSRNVGGMRAEKVATGSSRIVPTMTEGGGYGVRRAGETLDAATKRYETAVANRKAAELALRSAQSELRDGGYLRHDNGKGPVVATEEIAGHMRLNRVEEPAFLTQAPDTRGARNYYVAQHQGVKISSPKRSGEAVRTGTFDPHPDTMVEAAVRAQGLISAQKGWTRLLGEFSYRKRGKIVTYTSFKRARSEARNLSTDGKGEFVPVRMKPFGVRQEELNATLTQAEDMANIGLAKKMERAIDEPGDKAGYWVLMDRAAARQLQAHAKLIGEGGINPVLSQYSQLFRGVVLSTSPKWLAGNIAEASLRSVVAHAGPRSFLTGRWIVKHVERTDPEMAMLLREEVLGGGHYALSSRVQRYISTDSLGPSSRFRNMAVALGTLKRSPGPKQLVAAWHAYTDFVFNFMNRGIERQFQTAMMGKAFRETLMDDRTLKLSKKAVEDYVNNRLDLNTMVELGRSVDRMYGRYSKLSPSERWWISTYTPFIRWTLNAIEFVGLVLPVDHPVLTSVIASSSLASKDWRKDKGLYAFMGEGALPPFLQGSIPGAGGSNLRISRYTPFGAFTGEGSIFGTVANSLMPQFMGPYEALANSRDWRNRKLDDKNKNGSSLDEQAIEAGASIFGGIIPFWSPAWNIANNEGDLKTKVRKQVDPFKYTQPKKKTTGETSVGGPTINVPTVNTPSVNVPTIKVK